MEIIEVNINDLKPAEYNPRAMTTKEAKDLGESLMQFDLVEPLVVNKGKPSDKSKRNCRPKRL